MPPHLTRRIRIRLVATASAWLACAGGCADWQEPSRERVVWYTVASDAVTPPDSTAAPNGPCVAALGNLRMGSEPSKGRQALAKFFFGERLESGPGLAKPGALAWQRNGLLIYDAVLGTVVRWPPSGQALQPALASSAPLPAATLAACENGDFLATVPAVAEVHRYDAGGRLMRNYSLPGEFRPMAATLIGGEIWVTNAALHRLEVFDATSGSHVRAIGQRGHGPCEFNLPMGIAALPRDHPLADSGALVVDSFNARVQVLDSAGRWVRDLGGPGDVAGRFGRPIGVAVGPDGVIFVLDAASQRVHAFDARGNVLLAFGRQMSDEYSLTLPGGVCVAPAITPARDLSQQAGIELRPAFDVLVSEQLNRPGIRVYVWIPEAGGRRSP